jgi:cysteine desulfurase/selenocysteine lyase
MTMPRFCYTFELLPDEIELYEREHAAIWPGVTAAMLAAGVRQYSLFRRGPTVIATGECERSVAETFAALDADPLNQRWSAHIRALMHNPLDENGELLFAPEIWRMPAGEAPSADPRHGSNNLARHRQITQIKRTEGGTTMESYGDKPLLDSSNFIGIETGSYLYTGAHSPALKRVEQAMLDSYQAKSLGEKGREILFAAEDRTRASIASLTGRETAEVGLLGDASTAWSAIANGWQWKPGDNIVVNEYEHPAVFAPWLRLRQYGLEVRVVPRQTDWEMPSSTIEDACDERTIAIAVSHVGYVNGLRHDLRALGQFADQIGVPLLVDVSHSLGVVDVDLEYAALTVSASYKWSLGPYGVGAVIWNRDRLPDFRPGSVGWRSLSNIFTDDRFDELNWNADATRFQMGAPALTSIAGFGAGIDTILELGIERVERHALTLVGEAHSALVELGFDVITPAAPDRHAGNLAFLQPEGERFAARLAEKGVLVWGGDGRVRASFHVMNCRADVDRFVEAVQTTRHEFAALEVNA